MYISYNWLRELTGTTLTPSELREQLTMVGLAIDAVAQAPGDSVLDVEVPSNRPDCLSHIGIAREVSVIESGSVILPPAHPPRTEGRAESFTSVQILDPDLCPRYAARVVRGVKIGPSPDWLAKRLEAIGQRPINNVADITNYVLHEMAQPLHAFDLARLSENRIVVRRARAGEKITTLDGIERELTTEMLMIADAHRPVAVAGIMGGEDSEISAATVDVLIESAYFDPDSVRRTARALAMDTEASRRFERGVDYGGVTRAQERCVALICEIAGGVATENAVDVQMEEPATRLVKFRPARVEALTSLKVAPTEMFRILTRLGFAPAETGSISSTGQGNEAATTFIVPTWRIDVRLEEDLIEEIARHAGYDRIGSALPPADSAGEYQPQAMQVRAMRRILAALGYNEAINFSFIDTAHDDQIEPVPELVNESHNDRFVTLRNPIIEESVRMRPSLIPGLLSSLRHNLNHGTKDVRLFEIGRVFAGSGQGELPTESEAVALLATGAALEEDRVQASREVDFYDLKGALEAAADAMRIGPLQFAGGTVKHLREGQTAVIKLGACKAIGSVGRLADNIAAAYKFRQAVYVAELNLSALLASEESTVQYKPLARYPSIVRDVTLLVARNTTFGDLSSAVRDQLVEECRDVKLVGTYEGANIPEDQRSITLRLEYRSDDRTLRDDEVEEMHRRLIDVVTQKFAAVLH
ncbi:MAG TPA: phenylalanine--tRNA ligase subunit beta [Pyrinomonadaceae bacterium]|nr:phenylalanine--tRNA ligase subunit beta [Pyrinomonadaceae bacterium]